MYQHRVKFQGAASGTMPCPTLVTPIYKLSENVIKVTTGTRLRKRKGVWAGAKVTWDIVEPSDQATLASLLTAEASDATPFQISFDDGATYYEAHLSKDPELNPPWNKNLGLAVSLEFEFVDRLTSYPSPLHLGAGS